tara:strand:- start:631 stop:1134 length:504 start_codon:yes stop_codon:yes gene_type:complete
MKETTIDRSTASSRDLSSRDASSRVPKLNDKSNDRRKDEWKSERINELAKALSNAQAEMDGAVADSTNPFFNSSYADLHTCIKSSFPFLSKYGLAVTQGTEWSDDNFYITTTLIHESGQWMRSKIKMPAEPNPQKIGSVITYGRRYGLSAMVGIAQHDDDANSVSKQ